MLEDLAWKYMALTEFQIWLFASCFFVLGGLSAALLHRGGLTLTPTPYFALCGLLVLGIATAQAIWLMTRIAMLEGWLFGLIGLEVLFDFAAGYVAVVLGQARSRDAFGHGRAGIFSIIPFAVLVLLFSPSRMPAQSRAAFSSLSGTTGVVIGIVLLTLSHGFRREILPLVEANALAASVEPALAERYIGVEIRQNSVPVVLRSVAESTVVPEALEAGMILKEVVAEGYVLRFVYVLAPGTELDHAVLEEIPSVLCNNSAFRQLMEGGARIDYQYNGTSISGEGALLESLSVTTEDCTV